jgi:hypothetical protein
VLFIFAKEARDNQKEVPLSNIKQIPSRLNSDNI